MNFSKIILVEPGHEVLKNAKELSGSTFLILIGPEGGFSENEVKQAVKEGFSPLTLGKLTLRAETAPLVITTLLQYKFGHLSL